jgi:tRNA dimethylallyltransferase
MLLILGVTASGKGQLAFDLAENFDAEIISIDSMKVYRRMDIGTAKPSRQARELVKYHLIDIIEPSDSFSVGTFLDLATNAIEQIKSRNKKIIAVGGTALYIKALLYGLFEGIGSDEQIRKDLKAQEKATGKNRSSSGRTNQPQRF